MSKHVRNFWIELEVDGKKTKIATGPKNKDGGFKLLIKMREEGGEMSALKVTGTVFEGDLVLTAGVPWQDRDRIKLKVKR